METGTLKELNVKPRDVVECVSQWYSNPQPYTIGKHYTVNNYSAVTGEHKNGATGICAKWRIVSRASDTPKIWRDMTDEEKGARWVDCAYLEDYWNEDIAYRVKPKQVRGVVTITSMDVSWGFMDKALRYHRITFETINGEPDCSTIKMEELD